MTEQKKSGIAIDADHKGHEISYSRPHWLEVGHPGNRGVVRGDVAQLCP
jgi:hypothetical protein